MASPDDRLNFLRSVPLFEGLPDALLARLQEQMRVRDLAAEQYLFFQGDEGGSLVIVIEGKLSVQCTDASGATCHLADRGPGEHVGELSLIDDEPRSADVVALTACRVSLLNRRDFERAVFDSPELGINMMRALARRLREQSSRMTQHTSLDVLGRLALTLLELASGNTVRLSQRALAERIGATRETVNRGLAQLADMGAIEVARGEIRLVDRPLLTRRSQPL